MHPRIPRILGVSRKHRITLGAGALTIAAAAALSGVALAGPGARPAEAVGLCGNAADSITVIALDNSMSPYCGINSYNENFGDMSELIPLTNNRIWLHQYASNSPNYSTGWSYCLSGIDSIQVVPPAYKNPENIQISANTASC